jgi:N-acylneuraminate cytidylyltransferase
MVVCSRADGWGIRLLKEDGILVVCISTEENPVVAARCAKLDIPYWQGQVNKLNTLQTLLTDRGIPPQACLYVGNDSNDLACLKYAGIAVVPGDAQPEAMQYADWQTVAHGGGGVLREIARAIQQAHAQ